MTTPKQTTVDRARAKIAEYDRNIAFCNAEAEKLGIENFGWYTPTELERLLKAHNQPISRPNILRKMTRHGMPCRNGRYRLEDLLTAIDAGREMDKNQVI